MRFWLSLGAVLACLLALAASAVAAPGPGDFDFSFGNRGYVGGDTYNAAGEGATAVGPKGETFVLEPRQPLGGIGVEFALARFEASGARDTGFAPNFAGGEVLSARAALAVDSQGRPLVAWTRREPRLPAASLPPGVATPLPPPRPEVVVARFARNGSPDGSLGAKEGSSATSGVLTVFSGAAGTAPVLAADGAGGFYVAAETEPTGGGAQVSVAHVLAGGEIEKSFGTEGVANFALGTQERPTALVPNSAGLELGLSECCHGDTGAAPGVSFARLTGSGAFDPTLAGKGSAVLPRGVNTVLRSIAPGPRGSVVAAIEEEGRGSVVVRLLPSGGLDPTFGKGGQALLGPELGVGGVEAIATDDQDRIVGVAGRGEGGVEVFRLRKLGQPDGSFGGGRGVRLYPFGADARTSGFGVQPDGKIVVEEEWGSSTRSFVLARLTGGNATARCMGKRATIVGTRERDVIRGTPGDDVIAALGGNDKVLGLGGDDLICGGPGKDKLFGGAGKNRLHQ